MLTIQERIKDLRVEHGLTLQQLAEQTGLSASALGNYENDDFKDIGHFAIVKLAKFYGVTTDYLLGLSETKKHSVADINSLRLSDKVIALLQKGTINIPLLCEILENDGFGKLLADIEIYANGYAAELIRFLNFYVDAGREQIIKQNKNISPDSILYMLENAQIDEGDYFDKRIHDDMDATLFRFGQKLVHVRHGAETGVDIVVVGDVIALIRQRGAVNGRKPDDLHAQLLQVIQFLYDAPEISDAVAV